MTFDFHPIAAVFPLMAEAELASLADDIREHGQREPIVLLDGKIVDGRNRYLACQRVGVDPIFDTFSGDDPLSFVVSLNLRRRHLDESQRSMVAAKIATMRQGERTDLAPTGAMSDAGAAQLLNVGERSVERAKTVRREGAPNVVEAVERGEVSVSAAAKAVKVAPKETQETWTAGDIKKAAKEAALGGVKLPSPKKAKQLSKEAGGALVVGSDGKYHAHLSDEQRQLKDDWFAFKERLFGWADFEVTPERAIAATPSYQRKSVEAELRAAIGWLERFEQEWRGGNVN